MSDNIESLPKIIAGVFFSDRSLICKTAIIEEGTSRFPAVGFKTDPNLTLRRPDGKFNRIKEGNRVSIEQSESAQDDIKTAVGVILEELGEAKIADLVSVTIAIPGGFSDKVGEDDGISKHRYGEANAGTVSPSTRLKKWAGEDIAGMAAAEFDNKGANPQITCLRDADAMLLGEHYFYRMARLRDFDESFQHNHPGLLGTKQHEIEKNAIINRLGKDTVVYLLFDEGVSGAVLFRSEFVGGVTSLELGHLPVYTHPTLGRRFPANSCGKHYLPCLDGTVSFRAMRDRWKIDPSSVRSAEPNEDALKAISWYIAQAIHQIVLNHSPAVILLGGYILNNPHLLRRIWLSYEQISGGSADRKRFPYYRRQDSTLTEQERKWRKIDGKGELFEDFIKAWLPADTGVVGCLWWAAGEARRSEHQDVAEFPRRR